MGRRVCNYCLGESPVLNAVGFMYRIPICYCPECTKKFYEKGNEMVFGENYAVVGFGDGYDVPILLGFEEIEIEKENGVDVNMKDWLKKEQERIEKEREEILKEKGYEKLFRFPVGETEIELVMEKPKIQENNRTGRKFAVFSISVDGEKVQTGVNLTSPVYREFINRMVSGKTKFSLIRTGTGLDTRYSFKE